MFGGWTSASRKAMKPVFEGNDGAAVLPGAVRGPRGVAEHLLHRRDDEPADHPGARLPQGAGRHEGLPGRLRLRLPAHGEQEDQGLRRRRTGSRSSARTTSARRHQRPHDRARRCSTPSPQAVFNTLNGDSNVAFFKELQGARATRRTRSRRSRCRSPRRRSAASASTTSSGQLTAWNYYQTTDSPANEKFVAAFKAKYGDGPPTRDPIEAGVQRRSTSGRRMVEKAGVVRRRRGSGGGRRASPSTRPRAGHRQRRQPAHLQDGPDRQDRRRRPDRRGVELRRADRAGPVPRELRLGRGPVLTSRP